MTSNPREQPGPDLTKGVSLADFKGRMLLRGVVGDEAVVLARVGDEVMAVGASCTHYNGPLDKGHIVGDTLRCPWHHACFSLRTGEAIGAPAFDPVSCWRVERDGDRITIREKITPAPQPVAASMVQRPKRIVIVGGGAAGFACAEMLRRRGYQGALTILSDDPDLPCDRPNLSKDFLAGKAPEKWIPLKSRKFYEKREIDLQLATRVERIDTQGRTVRIADGRDFPFDRLLLATGAEPVRLPIPGADQDHVMTLRSFADSRAIVARAEQAKSAAVLGSGFIGLEVAASLRKRGLEVHVISRDERPLEKILGPELGDFIRGVHEEQGEVFHMQTTISQIGDSDVTLDNGSRIAADLVILGLGVKPRVSLAAEAGVAVDHGVIVDAHLETSVPGIYAAGDVARWPDAISGDTQRIEHWGVAERQGQAVAENMLGARNPYRDVPFFWSAHHDVSIRYVGHAQGWDRLEIDGDLAARDCLVRYWKNGRTAAIAAIGRDQQALECEAEMESELR